MKATDYAGPQLSEPLHDNSCRDSLTQPPAEGVSPAGIPMHVEDSARAAEDQGARLHLMCYLCEPNLAS
jgi:hypothetical protein